MAKPRSKSEQKRKQILTSATKIFTQQGYAATSMDHIANDADVSKQTVYSHFGNKEELFAESIRQKCDSAQMLDLSCEDLSNPQAILLNLAHRFYEMVTSKEALAVHKICAFESKAYPQLAELFYEAGPEKVITEVTQLMSKFHEMKLLNIPNPQIAAVQFLHMVKGEGWMRIEFNTKKQLSNAEVEHYIAESVSFFLKGYSV